MTLENCNRLLAHYEACAIDKSLSEQARLNAQWAVIDMKRNLANRGVKSDSPVKKGGKDDSK